MEDIRRYLIVVYYPHLVLTIIPNRSTSTFSRLERFCSSVGFHTARFIKLFSLKTNTRNVCFILRPKMFFGLIICLIKGIKIFQTLLTIYLVFVLLTFFINQAEKQSRCIFNPFGVISNRCDNFFFTY